MTYSKSNIRSNSTVPQQQKQQQQTQKCISPNLQMKEKEIQNKMKYSDNNTVKNVQGSYNSTVQIELQALYDNQLKIGNFKFEQILGRGAFAQVRLASIKPAMNKYAIKIYEKSKLNESSKLQNIKREISILKQIDHPTIIKLYYAFEDRRSINLVLEYIQSQSLASFAKQKTFRQVPIKEAIQIFNKITLAIQYLHSRQIAHRDIKMENILLNCDASQVKLIDFGFAIKIKEGIKLNVFCGTPSYMSPQIVSKTPHSPFSSDIWSLGILLSTLVTGIYPFRGSNDRDLYRAIQCAKWKPPQGVEIPQQVIKVINGCLEKDPINRWTVDQIIQNPLTTI